MKDKRPIRRTGKAAEPGILAPPGPSRHASQLSGHQGAITALAVSPNGLHAVSAAEDGLAILWDLPSGFEMQTLTPCQTTIQAAAFSPDGLVFALGGVEAGPGRGRDALSLVALYDTERGRSLQQIEIEDALLSLAFRSDGQHLLFGCSNHLRLWEVDGSPPLAEIDLRDDPDHEEQVVAVAVSKDGRWALAACRSSQSLRLIDLEKHEEVNRFTGHGGFHFFGRGDVLSTAFSPEGKRALSGSQDQTVRVWNLQTAKEINRLGGRGLFGWRGVVGVAWMADGERALSASADGYLRLWEVARGKELQRVHHGSRLCCLAATPDGGLALTGGQDGKVRVWETGALLDANRSR